MDNGRVSTGSRMAQPFDTFNAAPPLNFQGRSMEYNHDLIKDIASNELSVIFFSRLNVDALQEGIIEMVFLQTDRQSLVGRQSEQELKIIMRAVYYQNAQFKPFGILAQVRDLNQKVLDYCVPNILGALSMHTFYLNDIDRLPVPQSRGDFVSAKGTKVLEMRQF